MGSVETSRLSCVGDGIRCSFYSGKPFKKYVWAPASWCLQIRKEKKLGLDNPVVHDTDKAIQVAVQAIRELIRADQAQKKKEE